MCGTVCSLPGIQISDLPHTQDRTDSGRTCGFRDEVFAYKNGSISYNEDGISFIDGDGKVEWEKAYSIKNPIVTYCGDYIAAAYKNGNEILLYDSTGKVKRFSASYAVSDVEVAEQGVIRRSFAREIMKII